MNRRRVAALLRELAHEIDRGSVDAEADTAASPEPARPRRRTHVYKPKHAISDDDVRDFRQRLAKRGIRTS